MKSSNYHTYKEKLRNCISNKDVEAAHATADSILCALLKDLGYEEIVKLWEQVDKWYA